MYPVSQWEVIKTYSKILHNQHLWNRIVLIILTAKASVQCGNRSTVKEEAFEMNVCLLPSQRALEAAVRCAETLLLKLLCVDVN